MKKPNEYQLAELAGRGGDALYLMHTRVLSRKMAWLQAGCPNPSLVWRQLFKGSKSEPFNKDDGRGRSCGRRCKLERVRSSYRSGEQANPQIWFSGSLILAGKIPKDI
jgi:hypothetical protein